jgi:zinc transport system ATP-binding protein
MSQPLVSVKDLSAGYNGVPAIESVDLKIFHHDFIGVIGPNGGGKTTLSKVLLGILKPLKGTVEFPSGKLNIGFLPQVSGLDRTFPISVREVILSGVYTKQSWWRSLGTKQKQKCDTLINQVGLSGLADRPIGHLSGGQLQRVLLARAIINDPQLLILDEPNSFVDKNFEGELYELLKELNKNMAIFLISHDIGTISPMVKTIACVNQSLHYHPSNILTAEMLKVYKCPIDLITHGAVPHRVLKKHS